MKVKVKISKKVIKLAQSYALLQPESGYPDMNAAIAMAKTILRIAKQTP